MKNKKKVDSIKIIFLNVIKSEVHLIIKSNEVEIKFKILIL